MREIRGAHQGIFSYISMPTAGIISRHGNKPHRLRRHVLRAGGSLSRSYLGAVAYRQRKERAQAQVTLRERDLHSVLPEFSDDRAVNIGLYFPMPSSMFEPNRNRIFDAESKFRVDGRARIQTRFSGLVS
jgi:hypothetical protein